VSDPGLTETAQWMALVRIADSLEGLLELYQLQVRLSAEMGMLTVSRLDQDEPAVLDVLAILARLRAAAE